MDNPKNISLVMQSQIDKIRDMVEDILTALNGSSITKRGGLVARLDTLEEKVDRIEKRTDKVEMYQKLLWAAAGFVSMGVFQEILKRIFKQ